MTSYISAIGHAAFLKQQRDSALLKANEFSQAASNFRLVSFRLAARVITRNVKIEEYKQELKQVRLEQAGLYLKITQQEQSLAVLEQQGHELLSILSPQTENQAYVQIHENTKLDQEELYFLCKSRVKSLVEECKKNKVQVATMGEAANSYRQQLSVLHEQVNKASKEVEQYALAEDHLKTSLQESNATIASLQPNVAQWKKERAKWKLREEELLQQLRDTRTEKDSIATSLQKASIMAEDASEQCAEVEERLKKEKALNDELVTVKTGHCRELEMKNDELDQLRANLFAQEQELKQLPDDSEQIFEKAEQPEKQQMMDEIRENNSTTSKDEHAPDEDFDSLVATNDELVQELGLAKEYTSQLKDELMETYEQLEKLQGNESPLQTPGHAGLSKQSYENKMQLKYTNMGAEYFDDDMNSNPFDESDEEHSIRGDTSSYQDMSLEEEEFAKFQELENWDMDHYKIMFADAKSLIKSKNQELTTLRHTCERLHEQVEELRQVCQDMSNGENGAAFKTPESLIQEIELMRTEVQQQHELIEKQNKELSSRKRASRFSDTTTLTSDGFYYAEMIKLRMDNEKLSKSQQENSGAAQVFHQKFRTLQLEDSKKRKQLEDLNAQLQSQDLKLSDVRELGSNLKQQLGRLSSYSTRASSIGHHPSRANRSPSIQTVIHNPTAAATASGHLPLFQSPSPPPPPGSPTSVPPSPHPLPPSSPATSCHPLSRAPPSPSPSLEIERQDPSQNQKSKCLDRRSNKESGAHRDATRSTTNGSASGISGANTRVASSRSRSSNGILSWQLSSSARPLSKPDKSVHGIDGATEIERFKLLKRLNKSLKRVFVRKKFFLS